MIRSGAARTGRVCTSTLYTSATTEEKPHEDGTAHLHEGQAAPANTRRALALPEAAASPRPDSAPGDDAMLRTLDRIGKAALAWLDRTGGRR